jgi:hypothetical protein
MLNLIGVIVHDIVTGSLYWNLSGVQSNGGRYVPSPPFKQLLVHSRMPQPVWVARHIGIGSLHLLLFPRHGNRSLDSEFRNLPTSIQRNRGRPCSDQSVDLQSDRVADVLEPYRFYRYLQDISAIHGRSVLYLAVRLPVSPGDEGPLPGAAGAA